MRQIDNWDSIQETGEFDQPGPGAYIAVICGVEDVEDKEYLAIRWDFAEGAYEGENQATFDRAGFWPIILRRSYKEKALGYFKAFKTCVEFSNIGYTFNTRNVQGLVGKYMGVVLGEEEYRKNNGTTGKRLYVAKVRSVDAIRDGDYTIPELKRLVEPKPTPAFAQNRGYSAPQPSGFAEIDDSDGDLPF